MKKQLLIAAVAATMSSVAMADISIAGSAKANVINGVSSIEADLNITGKSGATTVVANISLDSGMNAGTSATNTFTATGTADTATGSATDAIVEDLYLTTSFEGVNIKVGEYRSGKSELDQTSSAAVTPLNSVETVIAVSFLEVASVCSWFQARFTPDIEPETQVSESSFCFILCLRETPATEPAKVRSCDAAVAS